MKTLIPILVLIAFIATVGFHLLPIRTGMFDFHDSSQPARVLEFTYNLTQLQFPPRMAPHWSWDMGMPAFTFYAPFAYWLTSGIHLIGATIITSLKLSFLLSMILAGVGMYFFLRKFFNEFAALLGAVLYAASPWFAVEIFVRGNLAETWFIALLPWTLYFLHANSLTRSRWIFVLTTLILSFTFTVHNIFSLISVPLVCIYVLLLPSKKKNYVSILLSLALSAYFILPALLEIKYTHAAEIAKQTVYSDHFLCWWQIWTTNMWGFGGSVPGCINDGMSFMIGKVEILFGTLGALLFLFKSIKNRYIENYVFAFILILGVVGLFLTTYSSSFIWEIGKALLSLFQFPWRLLIFGMFATSFFAAYAFSKKDHYILYGATLVVIAFVLVSNSKYFNKNLYSQREYEQKFLSQDYIRSEVGYVVPEYLPASVNYNDWLTFRNKDNTTFQAFPKLQPVIALATPTGTGTVDVVKDDPFDKVVKTTSSYFVVNIHNYPSWKVYADGKEIQPESVNNLGNPLFKTNITTESTIEIKYSQTFLEIVANFISLLAVLAILLCGLLKRPLELIDR